METWELVAREAIRDTIASYTFHADRGRFADVAGLFATDGVLDVQGIGGARAEGRDAILAFFSGVGGDVKASAPPGRMQHHVTGTRIEVESAERATAESYFTVMTGAGVDHWGRYSDTFAPDLNGAWLFAERRVRTDGTTPGGWASSR